MKRADGQAERRRFARIDLPATAMLLQRGGQVGRFTVQNLSAGGALLTGACDVLRSAPLRVLLELPTGEAVAVGAHVRRRARTGDMVALAVAFRHISAASEDRIQDALLELLDRTHRADHPAVLVVDASPEHRADLILRIDALARRVLSAEAPLNALRILDDPDENIDALLVRDSTDPERPDERRPGLELLEHVAESYPGVLPLLMVENRAADPSVSHPRIERCHPEDLVDRLV